MACHPAYFALNYDELLLGENVTDEQFWSTYNRPRLGASVCFREVEVKAGSDLAQDTQRTAPTGQDPCEELA